jgi:hypothetical protein
LLFDDPNVTPFVECPNCRRLLKVGIDRCPDCFELIEISYALASASAVLLNTKACAMANTIKTVDVTAPLGLAVAAVGYITDQPPSILFVTAAWPVLPILAIGLWFVRFGSFGLGDEDFLKARKQMGMRLLGWLVMAAILLGFVIMVVRSRQQLI